MFAMDGSPTGWASAWWPMPFASGAKIELVNASRTSIDSGQLAVDWARSRNWVRALSATGTAGYFHAQGHSGPTRRGVYWTFLKTRGSGTFVGVTLTINGISPPYYLEGNERAYVDGAKQPQIQGTGTEDFFGAGWYFDDNLYSLPLVGFTAQQTAADGCARPTCKTAYRLMLADSVPFRESILYEIEHGTRNAINAIYSTTAYWYQRP
jgi:hypothetical protein